MECAEHKVSRQRGPNGDFRGFQIANLPNHHYVRVSPENGAQTTRKSEPDLGFHRYLHHPIKFVLHRVLDCHNPRLRCIDLRQEGIQSSRLSRSGWTGNQNDAIGELEKAIDLLLYLRFKRKHLHIESLLVQKTETHAFSFHRRHRGDPHVDPGSLEGQIDPSILWQTPLRNVETRHDLQACDHRALQGFDVLRHCDIQQHTVHPVANAQIFRQRLDMDIRGPLVEGLPDNLVHELDHAGLLVLVLVDYAGLVLLLKIVIVEIPALQNLLERVGSNPVETAQTVMNPAP